MNVPLIPQAERPASRNDKPHYLTVGIGPISEHSERLAELLDNEDSGYGSRASDSGSIWNSGLAPREMHREPDGRATAANNDIFHFLYDHNRTALDRGILRTMEVLHTLRQENQRWPAHYPSVEPPFVQDTAEDPHPFLARTQSTRVPPAGDRIARPELPKRAETTGYEPLPESSAAATKRHTPEPRLVTPRLAREFSVLKIDLKMDGLSQTAILHSMRKDSKALAHLLDEQIQKSLRHLSLLRDRIEDRSSKVLITGDLNSGKSTFCNALLRRKILPVDEQPCTSIFCEVLHVHENDGVEEVHAIPIGTTYDRKDERTYVVYSTAELQHIVGDNKHFSQCKVYIEDVRTANESLLNNGILDIALIDAPGLNSDSVKTTAVFARQEEIDVVVFVVSATNHFTISARDFISTAAQEKAYIFIVVNGFDNIRNKERCQQQILRQVASLSPATFKESSDLVHFVSSNAIPAAPSSERRDNREHFATASQGRSGTPNDPDDEPHGNDHEDGGNDVDKGKGKEKERDDDTLNDFADLETSLRRFVLEKRARSKLAPAKTYVLNVLDDLGNLAQVNLDVAQTELDNVTKQLEDLKPLILESKATCSKVRSDLDAATESCASDVYSYTCGVLETTIADVSKRDLGLLYPGIWHAFDFAEDITEAILAEIASAIGTCETHARETTLKGVEDFRILGVQHLGDNYVGLKFQPDNMFRRRKDALARKVHVSVDLWDFVDIPHLWGHEHGVTGTSVTVTMAGILGTQFVRGLGWIDGALGAVRVVGDKNLHRLLIPGLITVFAIGFSYTLASIPTALPRRLSAKVASQLAAMNFTHTNAVRVSSEVRKALKIPLDNLRIGLQRNFEEFSNRLEHTNSLRIRSEVARTYFGNLVRLGSEIRASVQGIELEGNASGLARDYDVHS